MLGSADFMASLDTEFRFNAGRGHGPRSMVCRAQSSGTSSGAPTSSTVGPLKFSGETQRGARRHN